jgi:hypothetical protein
MSTSITVLYWPASPPRAMSASIVAAPYQAASPPRHVGQHHRRAMLAIIVAALTKSRRGFRSVLVKDNTGRRCS